MPKPIAVIERKILYKTYGQENRIPPKISLPRWWVGDTDKVILRIYNDKIVIIRSRG